MSSLKLSSKIDAFQRQGQAWFCTTGLPSDVVVEVGDMSFHLHKFPLLRRSGLLERLIAEKTNVKEEDSVIQLSDIPGGAKAFELVAKFCYGVKLDLTASNVVHLRCVAEFLEMNEDYGEGNLIEQTEMFLNEVVLCSWNDSIIALQTCQDLAPYVEHLDLVKRCVDSLAEKACTDPNLFSWPVMKHAPMQSPGGTILWNGISTGARLRNPNSNWWYEDVSSLSFPLYKRLISAMRERGIRKEIIAGSLTFYAKKYLAGLVRWHSIGVPTVKSLPSSLAKMPSEEEQRLLLEEIDHLLDMEKGLAPTKFLCGLLRTALILGANPNCISNLEKRIGMQLDQASLEDLLMPNYSNNSETLYNVDCVQRILENFLSMNQEIHETSPRSLVNNQSMNYPMEPITNVAKLIDGYLAEVAPDVNLKLPKFQALAAAIPDHSRLLDDGLYRAIDIYLKEHPWLNDPDREQLCRLMNCQKLSIEACTHAAQNERLPLRVVIQVLFFEQLQLRTSIAGHLSLSDNPDESRPFKSVRAGPGDVEWPTVVKENQALKAGMDNMRFRVIELEKECSRMRQEIEKLGREKKPWKLVFKIKSQMCSAEDGSVNPSTKGRRKVEKLKDKPHEHKMPSDDG